MHKRRHGKRSAKTAKEISSGVSYPSKEISSGVSYTSPLYAFDSQLWDCLTPYIPDKSFNTLLLTGDKRVIKLFVPTIKRFIVQHPMKEGLVLSLSLSCNLQELRIIDLENVFYHRNGVRLLNMISDSKLKSLIFDLRLDAKMMLVLPATLKRLEILGLYWPSYTPQCDYIDLNGAQLEHFALNCQPELRNEIWPIHHLVDRVINQSFKTLISLRWDLDVLFPLQLDKHTSMETLFVYGGQLNQDFVMPPNLCRLVPIGFFDVNQMFTYLATTTSATSIVHLDLSHAFSPTTGIISISSLSKLERLTYKKEQDISVDPELQVMPSITCAPEGHLVIECHAQPLSLNNVGPGNISIKPERLVWIDNHLPPNNVHEAICWPNLKSIVLQCSKTLKHSDYEILRQAVNVQEISITGDTLATFARRDGYTFLHMFPNLKSMHWFLDLELCKIIICCGFAIPTHVDHVYLQLRWNTAIDQEVESCIKQWIYTQRGSPFISQPTPKTTRNVFRFERRAICQ